MNVEIGAEAALFPEKEYINGIAVAVCYCERIAYISIYYLMRAKRYYLTGRGEGE